MSNSKRKMTDARKSTTTQSVDAIMAAIETVSYGLLELEDAKDQLEKLSGKPLVDAAARLNKQCNTLKDLTEPLKNRIKNEVLTMNQGSNQKTLIQYGEVYVARIMKITKTLISAEKVKALLGKKLYTVQKVSDEVQVSFDVRG